MSGRSHDPAVREIVRGLAKARDEQISRAVAMVDRMPDRGSADQIIAPLRARLARLRPARPLRFARLLFLPLDPLIVSAARWNPGRPAIPRTVIMSMTTAVEAAPGVRTAEVKALIEGRTTHDWEVIEAAGALLWKDAAAVLLAAAAPADWASTGLALALHRPLSQRIGALLTQAERLQGLSNDAARGLMPPDLAVVKALLADAIGHVPDAQPMLIALLLARVPDSAAILGKVAAALGQHGEALMRLAGEQAADVLIDQLETPGAAEAQLGGQDLAETGATVRRLTALLGVLEGDQPAAGRRDRLTALRERIRSTAQSVFTERLSSDLLTPLREGAPEADAAWEMENSARGLRALETETRRIGGGKVFDALLAEAADTVRAVTAQGGLGLAGGVRLMEIIAGPDVALALLEGAG